MKVTRLVVILAMVAAPAVSFAQAIDPAAARTQLEIGYDLRQKGQWLDAIAHLKESYRLDPQLKALINLADCEEHVTNLADAQEHWVEARDKAQSAGDDQIRTEAERRISALEARMPKLTIRTAPNVPADAIINRDGVQLGAASIGVALATNPGHHVITLDAQGHSQGRFELDLAEGQSRDVLVAPGPETAPVAPPPVVAPPPIAEPTPVVRAPVEASVARSTLSHDAGVALLVGGGISFGVAIATGLGALAEQGTLASNCDTAAKTCNATGLDAAHTGQAFAVATDIFGGLGIVSAAIGVVLLVTSTPAKPARVGLTAGCTSFASACLRGSF